MQLQFGTSKRFCSERIMSSKVAESRTFYDAKEKIWRGRKQELINGKDISVGGCMLDALLRNPNQIAQICDNNGRKYTNKEIATLAIRVAQHFKDIGVEQEDIIGICASNTDYIAPLVIGTFLSGAIISTLDQSFDKDGIKHIFSITRPKLMFCDGSVYNRLKTSLDEIDLHIPIYTMKDHQKGVRQIDELITPTGKEDSFKPRTLKCGSEQVAAILCSSGTTGLPKGVCLTHESIVNFGVFKFATEDILLCFSSLYWVSGLMCLVMGTLCGCTRLITDRPFSVGIFFKMIVTHKVTVMFGPPSQLALAVRSDEFKASDVSSLELYLCGGSAVPFPVVQSFRERVENCVVIVGYGMTEISGVCSYGTPNGPGCNGQLSVNVEVKILDDAGNRLGVSESGEVFIRKPFKWPGYYKNAEATKATYDTEGWIRSGDIGHFDEDGNIYIIDRKKDILKYNNFHFSPSEIEGVINSIPAVLEVCVCGIPDIVSSFLPAAAVVKKPNSSLTEEDVTNYVAERMVHFKHLRGGVYFVDSLPKTASGKHVRAKVMTIVENLRKQKKSYSDLTKNHANGGALVTL